MVSAFCGERFHASHVTRRGAPLVGRSDLRQPRDPQRSAVGEAYHENRHHHHHHGQTARAEGHRSIWVAAAARGERIWPIGGSGKHRHSLAGSFCKKYLGYEHSETGYRRIFLIR